ncbi:hypothetical protein K435DRAFT_800518 [Dendrothele bispora CBS 962.96]|uniref:Uncharacterized protein n=1 Tax=Dendrothele bispora (strain CBS 962.96) TaxID=1314807 RepID=A0A4S8LSD7_DENBC|nr:hypothetical protein K435DRAFT_800518 [Dendrothele bispora CBS 962.96]
MKEKALPSSSKSRLSLSFRRHANQLQRTFFTLHPEHLPVETTSNTSDSNSQNRDERKLLMNEPEKEGVQQEGVRVHEDSTRIPRSPSGEYVTLEEDGTRMVTQWSSLIRSPTPSVYGVGCILFSTTKAKLSICGGHPSQRLDNMPAKILVKYLTPDQVWVFVGALGSDKPFQKVLANRITFDKYWREFSLEATYRHTWLDEDTTAHFRIRLPLLEETNFIKALKCKDQTPVDWDPNWEQAYLDFKELGADQFPFEPAQEL